MKKTYMQLSISRNLFRGGVFFVCLVLSCYLIGGWAGSRSNRSALSAEEPYLVKDIYSGASGGEPCCGTVIGDVLYFNAHDEVHGAELWKSDGTEAGTVLVKDILIGAESSDPEELTVIGNTLYFRADDGVHGPELWKSDGTGAGTVLVKDIYDGVFSFEPECFAVLGGILYFVANEGTYGRELWKSDGTAEGTVRITDINTGSGDSYPYNITTIGETLYFTANDGIHNHELWKSDGTAEGTVMVKDINPGENYSSPDGFVTMGGNVYFNADDGTHGQELWKTDGTEIGTVLVKDIYSGLGMGIQDGLTVMENMLYFSANDNVHGNELWKSDGTESGTVMVKDIYVGAEWGDQGGLLAMGGILYFSSNDGQQGYELWKSDGTEAGTVLVKDINSGVDGSYPYIFKAKGGEFYLGAYDQEHGYELWKSDGTTGGTILVADIFNGPVGSEPSYLSELGNLLFFSAAGSHGYELWGLQLTGVAPEISLIPLSPDPVNDRTPTFTGTAIDNVGYVSSVEYQIDSTSGSWDSCSISPLALGYEESFEGSFPPVSWTLGGDSNWLQDESTSVEGNYSIVSGDVSPLQDSRISRTVDLSEAMTLSFFWKVDTSGIDQCYPSALYFCLNNESCSLDGGDYSALVNEVQGWSEVRIPLSAGSHTLTWVFEQMGDNCGAPTGLLQSATASGWVDDVRLVSSTVGFTCEVFPELSDGSHTMYVRATDSNGNTTSVGSYAADVFTVDTVPPEFPVDRVGASVNVLPGVMVSVNVPRPAFVGVTEPNAHVQLTIYSDPIVGETYADGEGNWSWTPLQDVPSGTHRVVVRATDQAGNEVLGEFTLLVGLAETGEGIVQVYACVMGILGVGVVMYRRERMSRKST